MSLMQIPRKIEYALRAMIYMADRPAGVARGSEIARHEQIPKYYLEKVIRDLMHRGLVHARRGPGGGYQLARHPKLISALDVINAVDGPVVITSCVTNHGNCDQSLKCTIREPLRRVNDSIAQVLRSVTISQMTEDSPDGELVGLSI